VVSVGANIGGPRSGTVTIAGQTFTVMEGAGACGAVDVAAEVRLSLGQFNLYFIGFGTDTVTQDISVTNISTGVIPGPIYFVLDGLPTHHNTTSSGFPPDSGLAAPVPTGTILTTCFSAGGDYVIPISEKLLPGQIVSFTLAFLHGGWPLNYSAKVLSGAPSH
jgi:hypothetical protein